MARAAVKRGLRLSVGSWNTIWMRLRSGSLANSLAGIAPMSSPSNMMVPSVLSISRITMVEVVDLPQPDSPTRPTLSPRLTREADAVDGAEHVRLRRRPAAHQLADHAADAVDALARIFLDQLVDHQQRLALSVDGNLVTVRRRPDARGSSSGSRSRNDHAGPRRRAHQLAGVGDATAR